MPKQMQKDVYTDDGPASVVILAGSLLDAAEKLLATGFHPTSIAESFSRAAIKSVGFLVTIPTLVDLNDCDLSIRTVSTSLNSKIVSQHYFNLAPMAAISSGHRKLTNFALAAGRKDNQLGRSPDQLGHCGIHGHHGHPYYHCLRLIRPQHARHYLCLAKERQIIVIESFPDAQSSSESRR
ncbi:hypothetical protein PtB15_1B452 [Puccinia triticina]|nr:hypothetical protein PtB15_1B452 [Puccinia triticina]